MSPAEARAAAQAAADLATASMSSGEPPEAGALARARAGVADAVSAAPEDLDILFLAFQFHTRIGEPGPAEVYARRRLAVCPPGSPQEARARTNLGLAIFQQGRVDEAHRIVKAAMACCDPRQGWHYVWALVHTASGEKALALDALELSIRDREGSAPYTAIEPRFDALHGDPRFERILAELAKAR